MIIADQRHCQRPDAAMASARDQKKPWLILETRKSLGSYHRLEKAMAPARDQKKHGSKQRQEKAVPSARDQKKQYR